MSSTSSQLNIQTLHTATTYESPKITTAQDLRQITQPLISDKYKTTNDNERSNVNQIDQSTNAPRNGFNLSIDIEDSMTLSREIKPENIAETVKDEAVTKKDEAVTKKDEDINLNVEVTKLKLISNQVQEFLDRYNDPEKRKHLTAEDLKTALQNIEKLKESSSKDDLMLKQIEQVENILKEPAKFIEEFKSFITDSLSKAKLEAEKKLKTERDPEKRAKLEAELLKINNALERVASIDSMQNKSLAEIISLLTEGGDKESAAIFKKTLEMFLRKGILSKDGSATLSEKDKQALNQELFGIVFKPEEREFIARKIYEFSPTDALLKMFGTNDFKELVRKVKKREEEAENKKKLEEKKEEQKQAQAAEKANTAAQAEANKKQRKEELNQKDLEKSNNENTQHIINYARANGIRNVATLKSLGMTIKEMIDVSKKGQLNIDPNTLYKYAYAEAVAKGKTIPKNASLDDLHKLLG